MQRGTLLGIFVAARLEAPCEPRASAQVEPGVGLLGDRNAQPGAPLTRKRSLTARVLKGGTLRVGDALVEVRAAEQPAP